MLICCPLLVDNLDFICLTHRVANEELILKPVHPLRTLLVCAKYDIAFLYVVVFHSLGTSGLEGRSIGSKPLLLIH